MQSIEKGSLLRALEAELARPVTDATYTAETLQGGTVGDVQKLTGKAITEQGPHPFQLVLKTQKQWDRHGDPGCWRREYDLYQAGIQNHLPTGLCMPRCLLLEEGDAYTRIWMAWLTGRTGNEHVNAQELALAAERLGAMQAAFHQHRKEPFRCLRPFPAVHSSYDLWGGQMKGKLAEGIEGMPEDIRQCLLGYAARADTVLQSFKALPRSVCHGDVHQDNLFFSEYSGQPIVHLIDWDSAGIGYMGEDAVDMLMEAFVYSQKDIALMPGFQRQIMAAYEQGAESQGVRLQLSDSLVRDLFALAWGFRLAEHFFYHKKAEDKQRFLQILRLMLRI